MEVNVVEETALPDSAFVEPRLGSSDQVMARGVVSELAASVRALIRRHDDALVDPGSPVRRQVGRRFGSDDDDTNLLCWAVEALFLHGLKAGLMTQLSRLLFSSRSPGNRLKMTGGLVLGVGGDGAGEMRDAPTPCFWDLLLSVSHRDLVKEVPSARLTLHSTKLYT
jgi:hypothetical protein